MFKHINLRLNFLVVLFSLQVICDSKAIKDTAKLTKVLEIVEDDKNNAEVNKNNIKCEQLPPLILADLLGEAYNARYMSINWPVMDDDQIYSKNGDSERTAYSYNKRNANDQPEFYVDETFVSELNDKPAWEVNHALEIDPNIKSRKRRSTRKKAALAMTSDFQTRDETITNEFENASTNSNITEHIDDLSGRNKRAYGRGSLNSDNARKQYPWKCESRIRWVDLGPDYFPRYLRTVECTKHYCWYKAFVCKAKSFAVKILRRRKGLCADAANLKKISAFDFRGDFGEVWKWEEVAINFCCDCAIA